MKVGRVSACWEPDVTTEVRRTPFCRSTEPRNSEKPLTDVGVAVVGPVRSAEPVMTCLD